MLIGYLFVGAVGGTLAAVERRRHPLSALGAFLFWIALGPIILGIVLISWIVFVVMLAFTDQKASIYRH